MSLHAKLLQFTLETCSCHPSAEKTGLERIEGNYRPVSNLAFISKIIEKACLKQFTAHCDNQSLMPDYQSAYRINYSPETTLLRTQYNILRAREDRNILAFVLIDLSAAFDMVEHEVLISVLHNRYDMDEPALHSFDLHPPIINVSVPGSTSGKKAGNSHRESPPRLFDDCT